MLLVLSLVKLKLLDKVTLIQPIKLSKSVFFILDWSNDFFLNLYFNNKVALQTVHKMSTILCFCQYGGAVCTLVRKKMNL